MNADRSQVWLLKEESETRQADKKNNRIQKRNLDPSKHEFLNRYRFILNRATDTIIPENTEEQSRMWHMSTMCKTSSEKGPLCAVKKKCKERHKSLDLFHRSTNRKSSRILRHPVAKSIEVGRQSLRIGLLWKRHVSFFCRKKKQNYLLLRKGGLTSSHDYSEKIFHAWIWRNLWRRLTELLLIYIINLSGIRDKLENS